MKYFAAAASLLTLMTACTADKLEAYYGQPNPNPETPDNAITFGTYMGKSGITRAGYEGAIDNSVLQASDKANGFGVFAYYTGSGTYSDKNGATSTLIPNFMYNEHITYEATNWTYINTKYWPNEVQSGAVDDQDNDTSNDPATTNYANGGNVTFFAYAPFVDVYTDERNAKNVYTNSEKNETLDLGDPKTTAQNSYTENTSGEDKYYTKKERGIMAITKNSACGDPKITYRIASDGKVVDLLWGTKGQTAENVLGMEQAGVTGASTQVQPLSSRSDYQSDLLRDITTNADLTKQKTNGKVDFLFKHALAKVGGSTKTGDPAVITNNSGLLVQLDIDEDGFETGGKKGENTVVTIKSIQIASGEVAYDNNGDGTTESTGYVVGGDFNLATGKWGNIQTGNESDAITHKIGTSTDGDAAAVLNDAIAEPASVSTMTKPEGKTDFYVNDNVPGVQTTRTNVYKEEANPFVFIPGTKPSFTITVDYIVRTFDSNLSVSAPGGSETGTWTKVEQVIKKNVAFTDVVQLNKMYSLVMHLGLTGVKFTAKVSEWDVDGWNGSDHDGEIDEGEVELKETYLPINVASETTDTKVKIGSDASVATAAATTSYKITMSDYSSSLSANVYTDAACTSTPGSGISASTSGSDVTVTLTANTSSKQNVYYVKITDDDSKTSIVKITQHAADINLTASGTATAGTGGTITLSVKDGQTTPTAIDLTSSDNTSLIEVYNSSNTKQNWTITKTASGASITVPTDATAGEYTIKAKVNDAKEKSTTFTVAAAS